MSDHNKCPSSEKEHEKCIFRLSYFHRIEPTYVCEKNKTSQSVPSTPAPGSTASTTEGTQTTTTPAPPTASCNCGLVNRQSRIVGGVETLVNKYPWMVRG